MISISENDALTKVKIAIEEILKGIKPKKITATREKIARFCEFINESNPLYLDYPYAQSMGYSKPLVPVSYFPTLITPIIQELFIRGGAKLAKGIIHTFSEIQHFKPIFVETPYMTTIDLIDISEKEGKKGSYFETNFLISLKDENKEEIAIDKHMFFLKIK